jgi:hypothetical protein
MALNVQELLDPVSNPCEQFLAGAFLQGIGDGPLFVDDFKVALARKRCPANAKVRPTFAPEIKITNMLVLSTCEARRASSITNHPSLPRSRERTTPVSSPVGSSYTNVGIIGCIKGRPDRDQYNQHEEENETGIDSLLGYHAILLRKTLMELGDKPVNQFVISGYWESKDSCEARSDLGLC